MRKRLRPLALQATAAERAEKLGGEIAKLAGPRSPSSTSRRPTPGSRRGEEAEGGGAAARRRTEARLEDVLAQRQQAEEELADSAGGREAATSALYRLRSAGERVEMRREAADALAQSLHAELGTRRRGSQARRRSCCGSSARRRRPPARRGPPQRNASGPSARRRSRSPGRGGRPPAARPGRRAARGRARGAGCGRGFGAGREPPRERRAADALCDCAARPSGSQCGASPRPRSWRPSAPSIAEADLCRGPIRPSSSARRASGRRAARAARVEARRARSAGDGGAGAAGGAGALARRARGAAPAARALAEDGERLAIGLVDVEPGQERAVAAALGWRAAALVADDPAAGLDLLERARAAGSARSPCSSASAPRRSCARRASSRARSCSIRRPGRDPRGPGYDPERGELWFAGETAEAVLLELDARRRALASEAARLARGRGGRGGPPRRARPTPRSRRRHSPRLRISPAVGDRIPRCSHASSDAAARARRRSTQRAPRLEERLAADVERARLEGESLADELRRIAAAEGEARRVAGDAGERVAAVELRLARLGVEAVQTAIDLDEDATALRATADRLAAAADDGRRTRGRAAARARAAQDAARRGEPVATPARRRAARRALAAAGAARGGLGAARGARGSRRRCGARVDAGSLRAAELGRGCASSGRRRPSSRREAAEAGERAAAVDVELARIGADADERAAASTRPGRTRPRATIATSSGARRALERRRFQLGQVNPLAKEEYEAEKARLDELATQRADLEAASPSSRRCAHELTETVERRFAETFASVAANFEDVAATLFPGGKGHLRLTEADEEGETAGIEIELRPAGKKITRLSLLSGGEKSLGAISFLFALFLARPCPFYLLDEVEAALDDTNIGRFVELLRRYAEQAQFVVITHQKRTMEAADVSTA